MRLALMKNGCSEWNLNREKIKKKKEEKKMICDTQCDTH